MIEGTATGLTHGIFLEGGTAGSVHSMQVRKKVFTEEADADENGWTAVILRIIQHHCVTKIIGFDVSYGYVCSCG